MRASNAHPTSSIAREEFRIKLESQIAVHKKTERALVKELERSKDDASLREARVRTEFEAKLQTELAESQAVVRGLQKQVEERVMAEIRKQDAKHEALLFEERKGRK